MKTAHPTLADGRWNQMSIMQQLANVGSEIERALNWRSKNNTEYANKAFDRALELLDLTIECSKTFERLREFTRMRELLVDFFLYNNSHHSTKEMIQKEFLYYAIAARNQREI